MFELASTGKTELTYNSKLALGGVPNPNTRASIHAAKPLIVEAKLVWAKRLSSSVKVLPFGANTKGGISNHRLGNRSQNR